MPTPPPTVLPWMRTMMGFGARVIARITPAKPRKNSLPVFSSVMRLQLVERGAGAERARLPRSGVRSHVTSGFRAVASIVAASSRSMAPGSELPSGAAEGMVAIESGWRSGRASLVGWWDAWDGVEAGACWRARELEERAERGTWERGRRGGRLELGGRWNLRTGPASGIRRTWTTRSTASARHAPTIPRSHRNAPAIR